MTINGLAEDADDPVVATYSVFVKPPLPAHRKLMVLQHPNTHSEDHTMLQSPPIAEIRLKPGSGMIEADVPVDYNHQYDRLKGMGWGAALQKSLASKGGGSLGLAGGFGLGAAPPRGRRAAGADDDNIEGGDWAEAVRHDRVLRTKTLGGLSAPAADARYMVGVFQGGNIHLTPVSSLTHLRPQMHYLDAATEQERLGRSGAGAGGAGAGGSGGGGKDGGTARAIHMTIKSASADGDEVITETMADRLRAVQIEPWRRMEYVDEDTEDAWAAYQECLFLRADGDAAAAGVPSSAVPGKGKEPAAADPIADSAVGMDQRVAQLETNWGEDELLRAVSGIKAHDKKPGEEAVTEAAESVSADRARARVAPPPAEKPAEPKKRPGRPPKAAATGSAPRRGGRSTRSAPRGGGAGNAMEVD